MHRSRLRLQILLYIFLLSPQGNALEIHSYYQTTHQYALYNISSNKCDIINMVFSEVSCVMSARLETLGYVKFIKTDEGAEMCLKCSGGAAGVGERMWTTVEQSKNNYCDPISPNQP